MSGKDWEVIQGAARTIASAITEPVMPGHDETGGTVACLTEAVMGITAGLVQVADALNNIAEAIREGKTV